MNIERYKAVWKILYQMNQNDKYNHIFTKGASIDSMQYYVNDFTGRFGYGTVSKSEVKATLNYALSKGWVTKVPRFVNAYSCKKRSPSKWIFK